MYIPDLQILKRTENKYWCGYRLLGGGGVSIAIEE